MAVYTDVPDDELRAFLADYAIGEVVSCKGIAEGVENSNYLLRTERGTYILTLYEKRVAPADLPFFLALMEHLARQRHRLPDAAPWPRRHGAAPALRPAGGDRHLPRRHVAAPHRSPITAPALGGALAAAAPRRRRFRADAAQ